jgi:hypothetical protein
MRSPFSRSPPSPFCWVPAPSRRSLARRRRRSPQPQAGSPTTASGKARIALLLPLSGRNAPIGQAMQQAAEMALFDTGAKDLALAAYDSGETGDSAIQAYKRAQTDGAALILGRCSAPRPRARRRCAATDRINIIAFSNDESVAQPGLWVMGIAAPPQVRRVVDYSVSTGIQRFAVLAPRTPTASRWRARWRATPRCAAARCRVGDLSTRRRLSAPPPASGRRGQGRGQARRSWCRWRRPRVTTVLASLAKPASIASRCS